MGDGICKGSLLLGTACQRCSKRVRERENICLMLRARKGEIAIREYAEAVGSEFSITRVALRDLPDWAERLYLNEVGEAAPAETSAAIKMIRIEEAWLRAADISHMRWDRGHSYTKLNITMSDGTLYTVKDWNGSAYDAETRILAAIEEAPDGRG